MKGIVVQTELHPCVHFVEIILHLAFSSLTTVFLFSRITNFLGMWCEFSQQLRSRIIEYFEKYHALTISEEEADEYLDSLAELFITFNTIREERDLPKANSITPDSYT